MTNPFPPGRLLLCLAFVLAGCGDAPRAGEADAPTSLAPADTSVRAVVGQTVYVPVYSHILTQDGTRELDLTVTLSVRNTDPEHALTVPDVAYYDSDGRLVRRYAERPFGLAPMASVAFVVGQRDRTGGVRANFLVEWTAAAADISPPIVEAVMVSTQGGQGVSLVSRGHAVRALGNAPLPARAAPTPG